jgi:hypothetical protein
MIQTRTVDYYPVVPGENAPSQYGYSREGVPNPYRDHLHNWRGGPLNEGSLYHGPNYYAPQFRNIWQPRPLWGVGGGSDMYRQDVNTRNGVFTNRGFGGGIFNSNVALGADTPSLLNPLNAVVWGVPDPRFAVIQGKLNAFLVGNGIAMLPMDGVLGDNYCSAVRNLGNVGDKSGSQYQAFLATLTSDEKDSVLSAGAQCILKGFAFPCSFPEMAGNPACGGGGGGTTPPVVPPVGTCPSGQVWNPLNGQCVALAVPPTCPSGQILNPLTGQCIALPTIKTCPTGQIWNPLTGQCVVLPSVPAACPSGQVSVAGQCIPLDPTPKACPAGQVSVAGQCIPTDPLKSCPAGTAFDASTGLCKAPAAAASGSNPVLYIVGGLAVVGLIYFATKKRK